MLKMLRCIFINKFNEVINVWFQFHYCAKCENIHHKYTASRWTSQTLGVHEKLMTPVSQLIASITPSSMILRQTKLSKTNCFLTCKGFFLGGGDKCS